MLSPIICMHLSLLMASCIHFSSMTVLPIVSSLVLSVYRILKAVLWQNIDLLRLLLVL